MTYSPTLLFFLCRINKTRNFLFGTAMKEYRGILLKILTSVWKDLCLTVLVQVSLSKAQTENMALTVYRNVAMFLAYVETDSLIYFLSLVFQMHNSKGDLFENIR